MFADSFVYITVFLSLGCQSKVKKVARMMTYIDKKILSIDNHYYSLYSNLDIYLTLIYIISLRYYIYILL